jgi:hypothetical protein
MAKRYHHSKKMMHDKSRRSEESHDVDMGRHYDLSMKRAGQGYGRPHEGTGDTTNYHEVDSGTGARGMIHTEPNEFSGLPADVKRVSYPKNEGFMPYGLNWGIEAEDKQMMGDTHQIRKQLAPRKA